jgi:hypothetical protein
MMEFPPHPQRGFGGKDFPQAVSAKKKREG